MRILAIPARMRIRVGLNSPRAQFLAISLGQNLRAGQDDRKHLEVRHAPIFPKICAGLNLGDFQGETCANV